MSSTMTDAVPRITFEQIDRANATDRTPVVFIHGLWLLPSSWDRWATLFDEAGYSAVTPGWPDDPETVEEAKAHPEAFAHKMVGQVAEHFAEVIGRLKKKPVVIGHSFGGLITQMLAGRGSRSHRWRSIRLPSVACCRCLCPRSSRRRRCLATPPTAAARSR